MKRTDLQKCIVCGLGVMRAGSPVFYSVTVESLIVDPHAVQRAHGLEQFFGGGQAGAVLSHVMGQDEDLAKTITRHPPAIVCLACAHSASAGIARIDELCNERADAAELKRAEKAAAQNTTESPEILREEARP